MNFLKFITFFHIIRGGIALIYIIYYLTPILSILFFVNCVSILKRMKEDKEHSVQTFLGSILFGFIIFSLIYSSL